MEDSSICPECGAVWVDGVTCQEHFHQMLFWESENPALGVVHHYAVLCYHLQHPSLYSAEMLPNAVNMLREFLSGVQPEAMREQIRDKVDSGKRKIKITARPDSKGAYPHSVQWTMTAADVVAQGMNNYVEGVQAWARSIAASLKKSGNAGE